MNLKACLAVYETAGTVFNIVYVSRELLLDIYYGLIENLDMNDKPNFGSNRAGDVKHCDADISKVKEMPGYDSD